ncbi:PPOX class F420-dependent oxidoreductase [Georgenia halophila]|uniref:PPOX class F420-dependent oxidoreductase n=1 Tax=Georgenia halophila TaxID=620889 RepID=A0ABP8LPJ1_9MICO
MEIAQALEAARARSEATLATIRRSGRPQLSNVLQYTDDDGVIHISITAERAKYHNLRRDPWTALHVNGETFWSYVVIEGTAELSPVAAAPDDDTVEELVEVYRALGGEHPDWDAFRRAMIGERRVALRIRADRAYGMLR